MVATAVPTIESLSDELATAVAALTLLDDDGLWRAARSHLPATAARRMEALHDKRQSEGLTTAEQEALATLVQQYERSMLVRARSAALLQERGYDVSTLLRTK